MSDAARYQNFVRDGALVISTTLPAAGASNYPPKSLDLGCVEPGPIVRDFDVLIEIDALPNLVATKNASVTLKDSDDGINFAPIAALAPIVVSGANGNGATPAPVRVSLPTTVRRYLGFGNVVDAGAGDNTAANVTVSLVF